MKIIGQYRTGVRDVVEFRGDSGAVGWQEIKVPVTEFLSRKPSLLEVAEAVQNLDPAEYRRHILSGWMPKGTVSFSASLGEDLITRAYIEEKRLLQIGRHALLLPGIRSEEVWLTAES